MSLAEAVRVTPLIYFSETFEEAATAPAGADAEHTDDGAAPHSHDGLARDGGLVDRVFFTILANSLVGVGFGLIMAAAMVFADRHVNWRRGILWGLAGFIVFALGPALQLPPEPPGVDPGALQLRGVLWAFIAFMSGLGLWLIAFGKSWRWKVVGIAALVFPHVIGIPEFADHEAVVPRTLIDQFIVAALLTTGFFWLCLGGIMGGVYNKLFYRGGLPDRRRRRFRPSAAPTSAR